MNNSFPGQLKTNKNKKVFIGKYYASKGNEVEVIVNVGHCIVRFVLIIMNGNDSYGNYHGNHSVLNIIKHEQLIDNNKWDLQLPVNCDMIFHRHWYWRGNDCIVGIDTDTHTVTGEVK
jgi:hypothetical protein